jgi:hypothetical protein
MSATRAPTPDGSRRSRRRAVPTALAVAGLALVGAVAAPVASARTMSVTENFTLKLAKKSGTTLEHRGSATGTVPGSARSRITLSSLSMNGTVTVVTKSGTLNLRIRGTARSGGLRSKFDGTATMAGGTGRYRKARGSGRFTGVVNRSTWAATIRATGSLTY